ncbi:MAG TPA: hypothetical protein VJL54_06970 [Nitrososphaera sp.]|nr:hypothetical protein [Nitrososphaera sp.]
MSAEDAFNQVPSHVTKFRIGDGMMWYSKDSGNELDFYAKNVREDKYQHLHFWFNGNEHDAVITKENRRDVEDEHTPFNTIQFLRAIGEPVSELLANVQHLSLTDDRFTGRVVILSTIPRVVYHKTKRDTAYFRVESEVSEYLFEEVDASIPQIGVMVEEPETVTDFLVVGGGEIHVISMDNLDRCAEKMLNGLRAIGLPE